MLLLLRLLFSLFSGLSSPDSSIIS